MTLAPHPLPRAGEVRFVQAELVFYGFQADGYFLGYAVGHCQAA